MNSSELRNTLPRFLQEKYQLTSEQSKALIIFKGNSKPLNNQLRVGNEHVEVLRQSADLHDALQKLPLANTPTIYRHLRFSGNEQAIQNAVEFFRSCIGNIIQFPEFLNCTTLQFFNGTDDLPDLTFCIKLLTPTKCRSILQVWNEHGLHDSEEEMAFTWRSNFRVISVNHESPTMIELEEVNAGKNVFTTVPIFK